MCIFPLATGFSNLGVTQTPTNINLSIGDHAEITCMWEGATERYRANWCFVSKENITKNISSQLFSLSNTTHEHKDVFVIKSATVNDTGFYYCEIFIEIPYLKKLRGNGTTVIVEEKGRLARTCVCRFTHHHKDFEFELCQAFPASPTFLPQHFGSQDERDKHKEGPNNFY